MSLGISCRHGSFEWYSLQGVWRYHCDGFWGLLSWVPPQSRPPLFRQLPVRWRHYIIIQLWTNKETYVRMASRSESWIPVLMLVQWCWDSPMFVVGGVRSQSSESIFERHLMSDGRIQLLFILWSHQAERKGLLKPLLLRQNIFGALTLDFGVGETFHPFRKLVDFFLCLKIHKIDKALVFFIRNIWLEVMYAPVCKILIKWVC